MTSLRQIRYFLTVAEYGSLSAAADALFVAQPALSRQMAQLEAQLGFSLFERLPRGVRLTSAGLLYRERMQGWIDDLDAAGEAARDLAQGEAGTLRLLHSSSFPVPCFLPWMQGLLSEIPRLRIDLDRLSSEQQLNELAQGKADLGLIRLPVMRREPAVILHPLPAEPLFAALPAAHRLAERNSLYLADLADEAFVSAVHRERGGLARRVADLCLQRGFVPRLAPVISRKTSMLDLVAAGLGVAVVPAGLAGMVRPGTVCRPLCDADAYAECVLATPLRASPLAERFIAVVRQGGS